MVFLLVFWSPKQVKTEESFEESWAKLRSHLPRVNPDCKEKKVKRICHEAYSWWQSCQPLLEHFLKSNWCMLYVISKLRKSTIQCFKQCAIWSWNEKLQPLQVNHSKLKKAFCKSVAESPFCCEMISQPFCTVLWISPWSFPSRWKPNTTKWKTTSQRCEIRRLMRSDFAALFVHLWNFADLVCTCEMVPSASRYLLPTLGDIFHHIFVVYIPKFSL